MPSLLPLAISLVAWSRPVAMIGEAVDEALKGAVTAIQPGRQKFAAIDGDMAYVEIGGDGQCG